MLKRGLTHAEAIEYVGVKRRTFDEVWRPRLVAMRQGSCVIFDRHDLDKLFDEFKAASAAESGMSSPPAAAGDDDRGRTATRFATRTPLSSDAAARGFEVVAAEVLASRKKLGSKR